MNALLKVLLPSACFSIVSSAYADDTTPCSPPCRSGYVCYQGNCIEQCNPPCPANTQCNSKSECVPVPVKKYRKHTGFYLSFNAGISGGINSTSSNLDSSKLSDITYSGFGYQFSFSIGGAVKENLVLFADLPSLANIPAPVIKVNGTVFSKASDNLSVDNGFFGAGIMYYFMPSDVFISTSIGIGTSYAYVSHSSADSLSYYSTHGFGARVRAGREWWVSRRWALGAVAFYQFTIHNSGDDNYSLYGRMRSSMAGISFSATYN